MADTDIENLADKLVLPIEVQAIATQHAGRDGTGEKIAVLVVMKPIKAVEADLPPMRIVARFRSRRGLEAFVRDLLAQADDVWPTGKA